MCVARDGARARSRTSRTRSFCDGCMSIPRTFPMLIRRIDLRADARREISRGVSVASSMLPRLFLATARDFRRGVASSVSSSASSPPGKIERRDMIERCGKTKLRGVEAVLLPRGEICGSVNCEARPEDPRSYRLAALRRPLLPEPTFPSGRTSMVDLRCFGAGSGNVSSSSFSLVVAIAASSRDVAPASVLEAIGGRGRFYRLPSASARLSNRKKAVRGCVLYAREP
jgi:hypothetical protein